MEKKSSKKIVSLKKKEDFLGLYSKGVFYVGKFMVIYVLSNKFQHHRLGIVVSKKVGNSVKRNKVRRLMKEVFNGYVENLKQWNDFIIVSRKNDVLPNYNQIKKEMKYLLKKLETLIMGKENC
jgi:ribonuclease P protein component